MLVLEGVDICYHSCISQMQEGIIYGRTVRGGRVEDGKVSVARGRTIEICMGERASMERSSISGGEL